MSRLMPVLWPVNIISTCSEITHGPYSGSQRRPVHAFGSTSWARGSWKPLRGAPANIINIIITAHACKVARGCRWPNFQDGVSKSNFTAKVWSVSHFSAKKKYAIDLSQWTKKREIGKPGWLKPSFFVYFSCFFRVCEPGCRFPTCPPCPTCSAGKHTLYTWGVASGM